VRDRSECDIGHGGARCAAALLVLLVLLFVCVFVWVDWISIPTDLDHVEAIT